MRTSNKVDSSQCKRQISKCLERQSLIQVQSRQMHKCHIFVDICICRIFIFRGHQCLGKDWNLKLSPMQFITRTVMATPVCPDGCQTYGPTLTYLGKNSMLWFDKWATSWADIVINELLFDMIMHKLMNSFLSISVINNPLAFLCKFVDCVLFGLLDQQNVLWTNKIKKVADYMLLWYWQ